LKRLRKLRKLHFGPAGIPHSAKKRSTKEGVLQVKALGLDAMELEFVRGVTLKPQAAKEVGALARQLGIVLTVHAPYYINLLSKEEEKVKASIERILQSARIGSMAGAWSVCFHAGYYMGRDPSEAYRIVRKRLEEVVEALKQEGIKIWIRPEVTGKPSQFGDLEEVLSLSEELDMVLPVVDFAHLRARRRGVPNAYEEFCEVLSLIENRLGKEGLNNMHIHFSGIEYGEKGERRHLNILESDTAYEDLVKALLEFGVKGVVISESPNLEEDAILLRDAYRRLRRAKRRAKAAKGRGGD